MPLTTIIGTDKFVSEVFLYSRCLTKPNQHISLHTQQEVKAIFEVIVVTKNNVTFDLKLRLQEKYCELSEKRTASIFRVEDTVLSYATLVSARPCGYIAEDYILK